ncbi:PREDICTED: E3 ubiquitin-protein ligase RNF128-like [Cyprinodon variegatus]|uniref:E3 ubiquitin-protein ligase RNF128-like n=1 Tax=Cyprinodon variegatus TaxID=28743 RepID=A0A3Q2E0T3_CYPVA|nr:PREDICTED: E3 ubiquitin-protein ligase RNF128-like [Cyprinodon variegatus]
MRLTMGEKTQQPLLLILLCLSGLVPRSAAFMFWTALIETSYSSSNNETMPKYCECGVYGRNSPLIRAAGFVVLPKGDPTGCGRDVTYSRNSSQSWIALVKRGNCTFSEKINAAKKQGADAVVVYNVEGSGNGTTHMSHPDADEIVAIMIGNIQGSEIARSVKNGTVVHMVIDVGTAHGPWMDTYWLYFLSLAFFIVTAASIAYFVFISANRLYNMNRHKRAEKRLKNEAKKAIGRLQVRTLKRGDELTTSDSVCAVCIESYKVGEVVTVLTCEHIFHKTCIEPWLLERRTCPMCKCDILKTLGVEEEVKVSVSRSSPPEVTVITVAGGDTLYEVPLNEPRSPEPEQQQHFYDNRTFEPEQQQHLYDNRAFEEHSEAARE